MRLQEAWDSGFIFITACLIALVLLVVWPEKKEEVDHNPLYKYQTPVPGRPLPPLPVDRLPIKPHPKSEESIEISASFIYKPQMKKEER